MQLEGSRIARNEQDSMGKSKKGSQKTGAQGRTRLNPLTGELETVSGTKAGKKRTRLPIGHALRTHDQNVALKTSKRSKRVTVDDDEFE